jgi:hypothetical protein
VSKAKEEGHKSTAAARIAANERAGKRGIGTSFQLDDNSSRQVSGTVLEGNKLFPGARGAETKFAHEELSLIAVQGGKFHSRRTLIFATAISVIVYDEKIDAPCLGSEMSGGGLLCHIETDKGLPAGAEVMFSRVHRGIEIGVGLRGTDPIAVEGKARRRSWGTQEVRVVLKEIDESFSWFGFDKGVFRAVSFHVELGVLGAAAGSGGRFRGGTLCEGRRSESKKK